MSSIIIHQDNLIKNPTLKPYQKTKLNYIKLELNSNEVIKDKSLLLPALASALILTGQRPKIKKAKNSVSAFKIRKNMETGLVVTLRGSNLNFFLEKLNIFLVNFPQNLNFNAFGNISIGIPSLKKLDKNIHTISGANLQLDLTGELINKKMYLKVINK